MNLLGAQERTRSIAPKATRAALSTAWKKREAFFQKNISTFSPCWYISLSAGLELWTHSPLPQNLGFLFSWAGRSRRKPAEAEIIFIFQLDFPLKPSFRNCTQVTARGLQKRGDVPEQYVAAYLGGKPPYSDPRLSRVLFPSRAERFLPPYIGTPAYSDRLNPFTTGTPFWGQFYLKLV